MAYTKREFIQEAALRFGAALVKVYDESAAGLIEDIAKSSVHLASDAVTLAIKLADEFENKYNSVKEGNAYNEIHEVDALTLHEINETFRKRRTQK